jgi:hypothetical protein
MQRSSQKPKTQVNSNHTHRKPEELSTLYLPIQHSVGQGSLIGINMTHAHH